ncbi:hypothetical protein RRF57_011577 [Xylaria bambusicola]|uniref:DUF7587 domain-containing protein n=1 Tax=Xylaria bambusicola TaxID=326684 RepID=A0AAN7UN25_9PEZI
MDQYRCRPEELPRNLYRVQYPKSRTNQSDEGLTAADTTTIYGDSEHQRGLFRLAVENHFTWSYRGASPFISLFSDREHAVSWACSEPWRGSSPHSEDWTFCTISTSLLHEVYVFKVSSLVDELRVKIPEKAEQHKKGGYICLHRVPEHAIIEEQLPRDVKGRTRELDDDYDDNRWDPYGGYDSDDSAVVNNYDDNMIRELEEFYSRWGI